MKPNIYPVLDEHGDLQMIGEGGKWAEVRWRMGEDLHLLG